MIYTHIGYRCAARMYPERKRLPKVVCQIGEVVLLTTVLLVIVALFSIPTIIFHTVPSADVSF